MAIPATLFGRIGSCPSGDESTLWRAGLPQLPCSPLTEGYQPDMAGFFECACFRANTFSLLNERVAVVRRLVDRGNSHVKHNTLDSIVRVVAL